MARKVPPENSPASRAMKVTKTKKPTKEAPTAKASVPPPVPARAARLVPPPRRLERPVPDASAVENTDRAATSENSRQPAAVISSVRRWTSRSSSALMILVI
jgi:hypothetical protein